MTRSASLRHQETKKKEELSAVTEAAKASNRPITSECWCTQFGAYTESFSLHFRPDISRTWTCTWPFYGCSSEDSRQTAVYVVLVCYAHDQLCCEVESGVTDKATFNYPHVLSCSLLYILTSFASTFFVLVRLEPGARKDQLAATFETEHEHGFQSRCTGK